MMRLEIVANHSVEENILEALSDEGVGKYYTKYPNIFGVGTSGPRMSDSINSKKYLPSFVLYKLYHASITLSSIMFIFFNTS